MDGDFCRRLDIRTKSVMIRGYFTVEAVMIMPIILGTIFLVIYMWFFQYNRCLMNQDIGILTVRGVELQGANGSERVEYVEEQVDGMYREQYFAWNYGESQISYERGKLIIGTTGAIEFPFEGLNFWSTNNVWEAKSEYSNTHIPRMLGIRTYRKLSFLH